MNLLPGRSLAVRLALAVLSGCLLVYLVILLDIHQWTEGTLRQRIRREGANVIEAAAARIDAELARVEETPTTLAPLLASERLSATDLERALCLAVAASPNVFGSTAAFEPGALLPDREGYAPYCYRAGARRLVKDLSASYDYRSQDWYRLPKQAGAPRWSEPYFDEGGGEILMATYSVPFQRRGALAGIVTADVALEWLQKFMAGLRVGREGYAFLVSRSGTIVTHPDVRLAMKATIHDLANHGDPGWASVAEAIAAGRSGFERTSGFPAGAPCFVVFRPLRAAGWSLATVFPEAETLADIGALRSRMRWRGMFGGLALVLVVIFVARTVTRPIEQLARAAQQVAGGELDAPLPEVRSRDEIGRLAASFKEMQTALGVYIGAIKSKAAAEERMESELRIARQIQMALIPREALLATERLGCDMFGLLEPARAVGGDLYDVVVPRPGEVCFVIGDVSDKGIPAALFMAVIDTLFEAAARETASPEALLARVNDALVEGNSANMFVTLVCGMLETGSGRLRLASGGHTRPVLLLRGAPPRFVDAEVGSVVGIASGLTFEGAELRLGPGDALFLYTDGVTEAHDPDDQLFGEERLLEHLSRNAESEPRALAQSVRAAVAAFAREAPQFDDIAILVVRRPLAAGKAVVPVAASRLEVPATPEGLVAASRWLGEWCKASGAGVAATHDLDLALDELVANVMDHGYGPDGSGTVRLFVELAGDNVRLEIRDSCPAFDPLQAPEPGARAEAGYGGLGIELVRRSMNSVEYVRENGENRVILERRRDT